MNLIFDNIIFSLQKSGGISVVWKELQSRLLKEPKLSEILSIFEYNNALTNNIFRQELDIPSHILREEPEKYLAIKRYLSPNIKYSKEDIFHSSYYRYLEGAKNITTIHDFTYEYYVKGIKQKVHSWQKKLAVLNSEKIICISNNTRDDLLRFIPQVNPDKIEVIYNGVNEGFYPLTTYQTIEGFPYEKEEFLLFVGDRKSPYKQFHLAVEVARSAKMPLVIVGRPLSQEEKVILASIKYHVLTGVSTETLNILYNNAFCLLYPSLYEGFGIPVIEAQRAGCPVIAGANSSITEVIGKGGMALEMLDIPNILSAIQSIGQSSYRNEIIKQGLENSRRFSWDKTYEQTLNVYKSLM